MNIRKIEKKLDKFSKLLKSADGENLNRLEKDLLLSYLREIYEDISGGSSDEDEPAKKTLASIKEEPVMKTPAPPPPVASKDEVVEEIEIVEEVQAVPEVPRESFRVSSQKESTVTLTHEESGDQLVMTETRTMDEQGKITMSKNMELIFSDEKALDLSDKLSRSRVDDILKTMGINDRILAIKELFGNSTEIFNQTIHKLNQLPDFESAKLYLMENVAGKYEWDKDEKWPDAHKFIKNVKRRYN
jgi:hypothetical protein